MNMDHNKNQPQHSLDAILHAALDEDLCKINNNNMKIIRRSRVAQAEMPQKFSSELSHSDSTSALPRRKTSASIPVAVPRPRGVLQDGDISNACSPSPSARYNYDLATWRMYHRITSARARRSASAPASRAMHHALGKSDQCQYPAKYPAQYPSVGIVIPSATLSDNSTHYDGEVFALDE